MKTTALILAMLTLILLFCTAIVFDADAEGIGEIVIPSINCKFDLSYFGKDMNAHQHIALLYKRQGCLHIGNHYGSSGTWKLENVKVGDKAYLEYVTADGCEIVKHTGTYVCYAIMLCDTVDMVLYHKGREIVFESDDLVCVTCVWSDSTRNYVAVFEKVS